MTTGEAAGLFFSASDLPTSIDIRGETPICGFSLKEYAGHGTERILLRTPAGVVLGADPWNEFLSTQSRPTWG
jgi:acyl-CoA reductase-like NAD-dependent aldehyde dehydrogenase